LTEKLPEYYKQLPYFSSLVSSTVNIIMIHLLTTSKPVLVCFY
jgi:hypothetical protein